MIKSARRAGLVDEPLHTIRVRLVPAAKNLQGDFTLEPGIPGAIDLAASAVTQSPANFIRSERAIRCRAHHVHAGDCIPRLCSRAPPGGGVPRVRTKARYWRTVSVDTAGGGMRNVTTIDPRRI